MMTPRPFDEDALKMRGDQWKLPRSVDYLAMYYPSLPWIKAQELWVDTVREMLQTYKIEHLGDLPYGKGYNESAVIFIKKLNEWRDNH